MQAREAVVAPAVRVGLLVRRGPAVLPGRQARPVLLAPVDRVGLLVRRGPAVLPGRQARPVVPEPVREALAALAERSEREAVLPARVAFPVERDLGSPLQAVRAAGPVRQE
jgi:hypothetical protein